MFQFVKYNLLVPFQYDSEQKYKLSEDRVAFEKKDIKICREKGDFGSRIWFQNCFKINPFERNYQMAGSPLLRDERYKMVRIKLESAARNIIGLHQNGNVTYILDRDNIVLSIPKIRLLFTNNRIGFIHMEILENWAMYLAK